MRDEVAISREAAEFLYNLLMQQRLDVRASDFDKMVSIVQQSRDELVEALRS